MFVKRLRNMYYKIIGNIKRRRLQKKFRRKLKNKDFSIICSNCIGGVIYNNLGLEFLSPTINLFFTQEDFIKFAINLKYYLSLELEFIDNNKSYPVAKLGDITVHFNHANSEQEAKEAWDRRKHRINYDNIYLIFYYREGYSIEQIREIEKANYKNVIVLTSTPLDLDYAYYIEENRNVPNSDVFLDKDKYGIRTFEKKWDFVEWLNTVVK